jgi:serine/threonine protein phosphatase PrpC
MLVGLANARGGDDNITVVLVHIANDYSTSLDLAQRPGGVVTIGGQS